MHKKIIHSQLFSVNESNLDVDEIKRVQWNNIKIWHFEIWESFFFQNKQKYK